MKFIIQIVVTIIISFALQSFLPWWTLAIGAFGAAYFIDNKALASFAAGFLGAALLWIGMAYYLDHATQSIITEKVNKLLPLNAFVLTGLIGGIVGGLSALTGTFLRQK
ncbi:MAG: hypothetical protein HOP30_14345 [Cyclobacteriaceae bacterium]|nr:hypothetical protein [Cyclobacteriaceae bacterium]